MGEKLWSPPKRIGDAKVIPYRYEAPDGTLLFYKLRLQKPDGKSFLYFNPRVAPPTELERARLKREHKPNPQYQKPQAPKDAEERKRHPVGDVDGYLYRMPELTEAIRYGAPVWWCAGEKDADRVQEELAGRDTATSCHGGEGKPLADGQAEWFDGFVGTVNIIGDRDTSGYRDMIHKYEALLDIGLDISQVAMWLPGVAGKGADAYDHLESGLGLKDLTRVKIDTIRNKLKDAGEKSQKDKAERKTTTKGQKRLEAFQAALREHGYKNEPEGSEDWQCPVHDDQRPSLGVNLGDNGEIILYCQVCCQEFDGAPDYAERWHEWATELLDALGLDWDAVRDTVATLDIPANDTEAAEWLWARHGEDIRWLDVGTSSRSHWIVWDGARWREDKDGIVRRWMHELSRELVPLAEEEYKRCLGIKGAVGFAKDQLKAARALGNKARVDSALAVAATLRPGVTVSRAAFDTDKDAIAMSNGILLLGDERASLIPSTRDRLMLRNTEVPYIPGARSPAWDDFLATFVPDEEMQDFLARMAGYTLLGSNPAGLMFLFQGEPNTGKSTFTNAISRALGEYAKPFELGALRGKLSADSPREDIAAIMHARLAHAAEMTGAWMLHADQIKRLTGSDEIPYRHLWETQTSHTPDFTPWISSNFPPRIKGADKALQVRLIGVPFMHAVKAKSDRARDLYTPDALASVAAWAIAGFDRYREVGLGPGTWPVEVSLLTDTLRRSLDIEDDFIAEMFEVGEDLYTVVADIWPAYETWCVGSGIREHMTRQQLGEALTAKGFKPKTKRIEGEPSKVRTGFRLRSESRVTGV